MSQEISPTASSTDVEEGTYEVIPDVDREKLKEFGRELAKLNAQVNSMTGVRRGIVVRAFEAESTRLDNEKYSKL